MPHISRVLPGRLRDGLFSFLPEVMIGEHEEEPRVKRSRFTFNPNNRFKSQHPIDLDMEPTSNPIPESVEPLQSSVPRLPAKNLSQPRECLPSPLSRPNVSAQGPVVQEAPIARKMESGVPGHGRHGPQSW